MQISLIFFATISLSPAFMGARRIGGLASRVRPLRADVCSPLASVGFFASAKFGG